MENRAYALLTGVFLIGIVAAIIVWAQWLGGDRHERVPYRVVATQPVSGLNLSHVGSVNVASSGGMNGAIGVEDKGANHARVVFIDRVARVCGSV